MTEGPQFAVTSSSAPPPQQQNFFFVLDPRDFRVSTHRQTTRGAFATATRTASVATHSVEEDYDGGRAENRLHSHHSAAADRPTTTLLRFGARNPNSPSPNRAPSPTSTTAPQRSSGAVPSSDRNEKPPFSAGGVIRYEDDNMFLDDGTAWRRPHQNTSHASTAGAPSRRAVSPSPELTVRVDHQNLNTAVKDNSFHPVVNQKSKAMDVAAQQRRLLLIDETEVTTTVHQSLGASHLSSRSTSAQRQIRIPTSSQAVDARSTSPQARTTTRGAAAAGYHTTVAAGDDVDDIVASPPPRWLVLHRMAEVLQSKKQLAAEEHAAEEALQVEREVAAMKHEQRMLANRRLRSNSTGGAAVSNGSAAITPRVRASKVVHSTAPSSTSTSRHHVEHEATTEHCYSETTSRSSSAADQGVTSNSGAIVFKRKVAPELETLIAAARSRSSGVKSTTSDVAAAAESVSANIARSKFVQQLSASSSNSLRDEVLRDAPSRSGDDSDDNHADTPPPRAEVSAPPMPSPSLHQKRPVPATSPRGSDDQDKKQTPQFTREEYVLPEYSFHPIITRGPRQEYYEQRGLVSATQTTNHGTKSAEEDVPRQEQQRQQFTTAASNLTSEGQPQPTTMEPQRSESRDVVHVMPVAAAVSPSYEALEVEVSATTPPPVLSPTPHIVDEGHGIPPNEASEDIVTTGAAGRSSLLPPVIDSTPHQQTHGEPSARGRDDVRHEPFGDDDGDDVSAGGSSPPTIDDTVVAVSGSAASEKVIAPPPISNIMHNESGRLYNDEDEELLPSPVPELYEETASNGGDDAGDAIHGVSDERSPPPPPPVAAETPRTKYDDDEEITELVFSPRSAMEAILREGEAALEEYEKQHPPPTPPPSGDAALTTMEDVSNTGKAPAALEPTPRTPVDRRRGGDDHLTEIPTILRDPQSITVHSPPQVRTPSPVIMVAAVAATSSSHVVAAAAAASAQSPPPHSRNTAQQHQQHMYRIDSTDDCDDDLVVYQQTGQHHSVYQSNLYRGATVIAATSAVSIQNTLPTTIAGRPSGGVDTTPVDAGRGNHLPVPSMNSVGSPTPPTTARSNATPTTVVDSESEWAFHGLAHHTVAASTTMTKQQASLASSKAAPIVPKTRGQPTHHDRSDSVEFNFSIHSDVGVYSSMQQQQQQQHQLDVHQPGGSSHLGSQMGRRHRWGDPSQLAHPGVAAHGDVNSSLHADDSAAFVSHSRTQSVEHDELLQAFGGTRRGTCS